MNLSEKKKMVVLAKQIIDGSIDIIDGCRQILALKIYPIENPDYRTIVGFESETDEFPIGEVRKQYHKESLEKLDKELNKYINQNKPIILEACRNLISLRVAHGDFVGISMPLLHFVRQKWWASSVKKSLKSSN